MDQCKNMFGIFVVDYWKEEKWVNLNKVDINLNDLNKILNVIFLIQEEDTLIWKYNPNGLFFVSSLYTNAFEEYQAPCWAKAWYKGMTPKVDIFFGLFCRTKF